MKSKMLESSGRIIKNANYYNVSFENLNKEELGQILVSIAHSKLPLKLFNKLFNKQTGKPIITLGE